MFHYVGNVSGTDASRRLYALQDALIEVVQVGTDVPVAIFADEAGTPISTASGYTNRAIADNYGNYDFWIPSGIYDLKVYNAAGQSERRIVGLSMYGALNSAGGDHQDDIDAINLRLDGLDEDVSDIEQFHLGLLKAVALTQSAYNAIGTPDNGTLYVITAT
jgi:hypothetical protein